MAYIPACRDCDKSHKMYADEFAEINNMKIALPIFRRIIPNSCIHYVYVVTSS